MGGLGKFAVGALGITATAALAAGAALLKIGSDFDSAADSIAIKTGATGDALDGLVDDFKSVFGQVPVSMDKAADAVANINQQLGLTGKPLQDASVQYLNLARILDTDVGPIIESTAQTFKGWGVDVAAQPAALDMLFAASQKSGIGIDVLADSLGKFRPQLQAAGFDLTESTALITQWEKQGLNGEAMLGALAIGTKKLAAEGIPVREGLADQIAKIKGAATESAAAKIAVELFGKQGLVMADAIRKGAFEIDAMSGELVQSQGQINKTATGTDDWTQKLGVLTNKLQLALAPAADAVFSALGALIEWVTPFVEQLAAWIGENLPGAMTQAGNFLKQLTPLFQTLGTILGWIGENVLPIVGAGFQTVGSIIGTVISAVQTLVGWLRDAWTWANNALSAASNAANAIPGVAGLRNILGFAEGGSFIANRPTVAMFGEGNGPELVTATPLSRGIGEMPGSGHGHPVVLEGRIVGGLLGRRTVIGTALAGAPIG